MRATQGEPVNSTAAAQIRAIVIGGSAGSLEVLRIVLAALPAGLCIPVVVVVHLPPQAPAQLHDVLQHLSVLPMKQAEDKEQIAGGTLYFAPPGYHLLIEAHGAFALSVDEPVHFSRPSIDVLFESANDAYDGRVLGMLLSGASFDGAAGLAAIHTAGGITIVQTPDSAEAAAMPDAALALFQPSHVMQPQQMGEFVAAIRHAAVSVSQ